MAGTPLHTLIRHLRGAVRPPAPEGLTDAQLLERFVQRRDEAAFELLVWRHGAMVLNVCLRVLRRAHDAEDAFQATFLALVRKAGAIGKCESVGSWLYKVAYRVALRARTAVPVLSLPEGPLEDRAAADPDAAVLARELGSVLDEEVQRLSDKYRAAFVLCQLEGQTIEAAARILGCPPGTVGTRVARARQLLRRRLTHRGVDPSAPIAARHVVVALPAALVGSTVRAVAGGMISAHVADLTKGVLRTMFLTKSAKILVVLVGLGLAGGVAVRAHRARAVEPAPLQAAGLAEYPVAPQDEPDVVLAWKFVKDRPFYQEVTTETEQVLKVTGRDVKQKQAQTFYFRWTPVKKDGDNWQLEQRIEGVKMDVDIGGSRITFDSTQDNNAANALAEFYRSLVGAEFTVTLTREYKVQKVEGREELLGKRGMVRPELEPVLSRVLREDAVRMAAETPFAGLPRGPVRAGDSWTAKHPLDLGPLGEYQATYRYTYRGREGELDKLTIAMESLGDRPPAGGDARVPLKIKPGDLRCMQSTGTLLFDRARGRSVRLELQLKVEGRLPLADGRDMELAQTQRIRIKTTDTNPLQRASLPGDDKDREIERLRQENERLRRQLRAIEEALQRGAKPGY
jgi:RNA polymerase sigma factor (sigma-70 family)